MTKRLLYTGEDQDHGDTNSGASIHSRSNFLATLMATPVLCTLYSIDLCMLERTIVFACPIEIARLGSFVIVHLHFIHLYHLITIRQRIRFFVLLVECPYVAMCDKKNL